MARVALVTGRRFRHLWMIDLACRALGDDVVGGLVQADVSPATPGGDRWSRIKRSAKRLMLNAGLDTPVYLDLTPPDRHLWMEHGEPRLDWQTWCRRQVLVTTKPNDGESLAWLDQLEPDLLLVFGGKILAPPWFEQPRLGAMNLHYGITPDYRGSESVVWAAYHRNWSKVGATVHYLDDGIDTGPVINYVPVSVRPGDGLDTLTARVYWQGMNEFIRLASQSVRRDRRLPTRPTTRQPAQFYPSKGCAYEVRSIADRHVRQRANTARSNDWRHYVPIKGESESSRLRAWSESLARRPAANDDLPAGVYILLYHDLSPAADRPWQRHAEISTDPDRFREHLAYVNDNGRWVSPAQGYARLARNDVDEPLFVLTFDDGFASVHQHARSIVSELAIEPMLFLNGAALAQGHVHYRVLAAILASEDRTDTLVDEIREAAPRRLARKAPTPAIVARWLKQNYDRQWTDRLTTDAYHRHHDRLPTSLYLGAEQVADLTAAGWTVGNHTWSHARLSRLSPEQVADELERNERWLADLTGRRPTWVSYPYGFWNDLCPVALDWVERDPRRVGVMADGGVNFTLERAALRRIPIGDDNLTTFRQRLHQSILQSQQDRFRTVLETT